MNTPTTPRPAELYCSLCQRNHAVDASWWVMRGQPSGRLESIPLTPQINPVLNKKDCITAIVCGQYGVLAMTERWMAQLNFDPPPQTESPEATAAEELSTH